MATYTPAEDRYTGRADGWFRRCGRSGVLLPAVSLGMWHNFGAPGSDAGRHEDKASFHDNAQRMLFTALDHGITHFDLANNYGPPPGAAEQRVGRILKDMPRDELIISSKAGWTMWPGPYGDFGSRKYLIASLDQSLKRLDLDYVDIFYHHRPDPGGTPLEETLGALDQIVRSGKALYAGISSYSGVQTAEAARVVHENRFTPLLIHQPNYNMFSRWIENDLLPVVERHGIGVIAFCPLAQGLLTNKYLGGIPKDSRAASVSQFLKAESIKDDVIARVRKLNELAQQRGQSLAQMSLQWVLRDPRVTTALIGASRPEQIVENARALDAPALSDEELAKIEAILK